MAENEAVETQEPEIDYIETINQLKANSVNKSDYEKLKAENQKLLKSIINGEEIPASAIAQETSKEDLRKELYGGEGFHGSDIEFWKKTLELREKVMDEEGYDPFVPKGRQAVVTAADYEVADRVASVVRDVLEYANGDNALFISELNKRTTGTGMDRVAGRK